MHDSPGFHPRLNAPTTVAGNDGKQAEGESILQPEWAPNGTCCHVCRLLYCLTLFTPPFPLVGALFFISDRTNWWNLYVLPAGSSSPSDATPVLAKVCGGGRLGRGCV